LNIYIWQAAPIIRWNLFESFHQTTDAVNFNSITVHLFLIWTLNWSKL